MTTLYRKYRPRNFAEVVSQNHIKITLEHQVQSGKVVHAYLFCGPRAIGKTTLARVLAKAVNCEKRQAKHSEPCNNCNVCESVNAGRSLDIIEIDAASHTGVDHVRESIIASARVAPSMCRYKVFIIDEVHMLSISAFNALLKVLEEPPEYVIFILCTTEIHKVPTTIISRCQRFDFKRMSMVDVVKKLQYIVKEEGIKIDKKILEAIARHSEGYMRDAESLLGQIVAIGGQEITQEEADLVIPRSDASEIINLIGYLAKKDAAGGIQLVNKLLDEGVNLKQFLSDLIEILRKIMLAKLNPALDEKLSIELGEHLEVKVNNISKDLSVVQLMAFIEGFVDARRNLKGSFILQLPFELAIVKLCITKTISSGITTKSDALASSFKNPQPYKTNKAEEHSMSLTTSITSGKASEVTIDNIIAKWHEVLAKIKRHNHSLSFILRVCQPKKVNANQLCLAFKYKFHKERVGDRQIKALIERVLNEVYGSPLTIEAIIDEGLEVKDSHNSAQIKEGEVLKMDKEKGGDGSEKKEAEGNGMIDNLLKTFGGKVVK